KSLVNNLKYMKSYTITSDFGTWYQDLTQNETQSV
ncbi:unnamed protein product, partial [marine sediment metagenome]